MQELQELREAQEPQGRTEDVGCVGHVRYVGSVEQVTYAECVECIEPAGLVEPVEYEVPELAVVGDFAELTLGLPGWHHDAYGGHFRHD